MELIENFMTRPDPTGRSAGRPDEIWPAEDFWSIEIFIR